MICDAGHTRGCNPVLILFNSPKGYVAGGCLVTSAIRVIVVDDFEPFRRFVRASLQARPDIQVICEVSDGLEAVAKAEELQPDLILLDIGLAKLDGIEVARRLRHRLPGTKILFVSANCDTAVIDAALSTGANGYVLKADARSELLPAIKAVLQSEVFVSAGIKTREQP